MRFIFLPVQNSVYQYIGCDTRQSSHSTRYERVDSTSTRLAHGYLVAARLRITPHQAVHRGIHTRRACIRASQFHFFIVSHRVFSTVVLIPADFGFSVTGTSGISCNLAAQFDIPPRQKTVFICCNLLQHLQGVPRTCSFYIIICTSILLVPSLYSVLTFNNMDILPLPPSRLYHIHAQIDYGQHRP